MPSSESYSQSPTKFRTRRGTKSPEKDALSARGGKSRWAPSTSTLSCYTRADVFQCDELKPSCGRCTAVLQCCRNAFTHQHHCLLQRTKEMNYLYQARHPALFLSRQLPHHSWNDPYRPRHQHTLPRYFWTLTFAAMPRMLLCRCRMPIYITTTYNTQVEQ